MIAPLRPQTGRDADSLTRARHFVARTLLAHTTSRRSGATVIRPWQAWLFVTWLAVVGGVYLQRMLH
jgi:hypothetical protein